MLTDFCSVNAKKTILAEFAPPTRLLKTTKWHARLHATVVIDPDITRLQFFSNSMNAIDVVAEHPGTEAILGVVG
jgi:hypothetical protein